jgi:hypothetical protein
MGKKNTVEYLQMDLIPPTETEIESLTKNVVEIKESCDKVRKGMFKRHSELLEKIEDVKCKLENLEAKLGKILVGFAKTAQQEPEESGRMDILPRAPQMFAMSVDALQVFAIPEIGLGQIFGKSI